MHAVAPRAFLPFTTERLTVRAMRPSDVTTFATYRNLPEVARYQDWELPYTRDLAHQLIDEMDGINGSGARRVGAAGVDDVGGSLVGDLAVFVDADVRAGDHRLHDEPRAPGSRLRDRSCRRAGRPALRPAAACTASRRRSIRRTCRRRACSNGSASGTKDAAARRRTSAVSGPTTTATRSSPTNAEPGANAPMEPPVDVRLVEITQDNVYRGRTAGHPPLAGTVRRDHAGVVHRRARARDHRRPSGRPVDAGDRGRR